MSEPGQAVTANYPIVRGTDRRRVTRPLALATPVALLLLLTACGGSTDSPAGGSTTAPAGGSTTGGADGAVLTGTVGEGDAFTITLVDSTGAPVTSLKAGDYTVKVKDASKIHDFHLTGPGVEEKTTVPEMTEATWKVTLQAGTYTFKCDPHAKMTGSFTVT